MLGYIGSVIVSGVVLRGLILTWWAHKATSEAQKQSGTEARTQLLEARAKHFRATVLVGRWLLLLMTGVTLQGLDAAASLCDWLAHGYCSAAWVAL